VTNDVVETLPAPQKCPDELEKETCKSMKHDENEQISKKGPRWSWARNQMGSPDFDAFASSTAKSVTGSEDGSGHAAF